MTNNEIKINEIKNTISAQFTELKKIYNDTDTSLNEMALIMDYARLLNVSDFVKTITE